MGSVQVGRVQPFEVDHRPHTPILLLHQKNGADEAGRRGMQGNLLDGPFFQHGLHLDVDEEVVRPLRRSGETYSGAGERGRRREGGAIALHGLEQMRGSLQKLLPKGKEVAQSASDP
jgi:hypothetical protein